MIRFKSRIKIKYNYRVNFDEIGHKNESGTRSYG